MKNPSAYLKMLALSALLLSLTAAGPAFAQNIKPTFSPAVSASAAPEQVRFLAHDEVTQIRLEVFALGGAQLYDSDFKAGNLFDWSLQDQQGQRLADGAYRCLLTVKDMAGHANQRQGLLLVQAGQAVWQSPEQSELALRAFNPASANERVEFFTTVPADKGQASVALAHDGSAGRLMTSSGALAFRTGDFLTGKDQEQMRLTADGKLGVGVTEPQARLDVAGPIRTSEGIVFPDGTIQTTAYVASGRSLSERAGLQRDVQDRKVDRLIEDGSRVAPARPNVLLATAGRLAKYDGSGNLIDSGVLETFAGGGLVDTFGNTAPTSGAFNHVVEIVAASGKTPLTLVGGAGAMEFWKDGSASAAVAFGMAKPAVPSVVTNDMVFSAFNGATWSERMRLTNGGNLGIGTNNPTSAKLHIEAGSGKALYAHSTGGQVAVYGDNTGVGDGVWGYSSEGSGVYGHSDSGQGVYGQSDSGDGVYGASSSGFSGYFTGKVHVTGLLQKGGGSFKIDHPLDPENKYLYHSFVESPDMMNIYNGNVTTSANGEAVVALPDYFEALNRDFRYQLTVIGQFAQAIISGKLKDNQFMIKTDKPNVEVSWQVTGIRQDPFANANRIPVEELKSEKERGSYLHPAAFGKADERGVEWVRSPEVMRQMKERREQAQQRPSKERP